LLGNQQRQGERRQAIRRRSHERRHLHIDGTIAGDEIKVTVKSDNSNFPGGELTLKRSK
jgi:hypothetical protein